MGMFKVHEYFDSMAKWNRAENEAAKKGDGHGGRLAWREVSPPPIKKSIISQIDEFQFVETYSHSGRLYSEDERIPLDIGEADGRIYASSIEEAKKRMERRISPSCDDRRISIGDFRGFYWGGVAIYDTRSMRLSEIITHQTRNSWEFKCKIPTESGSVSFILRALDRRFRVAIYEKKTSTAAFLSFGDFLAKSPALEDEWDSQNRVVGHKVPFRCYAIMKYAHWISLSGL